MGHRCCNKQKVKRGLWSPEEDEKLIRYVTTNGHGCWSTVPKQAGLQRCGKSCRLRWINYLRPDLKRGSFSLQEERTIIDAHRLLGNRWAQIARHLPGRTDNEVKNFWNSCMRKKLLAQGIDPKTHKFISELEMHEHRTPSCSHEPTSGFQDASHIPNSDQELGGAPMRGEIMSKFIDTRDAGLGENVGLPSYGLGNAWIDRFPSYDQGQILQEDMDFQLPFTTKDQMDGNLNGKSETAFHAQANNGNVAFSRFEQKPYFPVDQTLSAHVEQFDIGPSGHESHHPLISSANAEAAIRFNAEECHHMNTPRVEANTKPMHLPRACEIEFDEFNSQQLQASNYHQYLNQYLISYSSSASSAYGEQDLGADLSLDSSIPVGIYFGMIK
eukprot:PITA_30006